MRVYDAIVIGAGPAGSVASIVMTRAGLDVVVLDRGHHPQHRLGESLMPRALQIIRELGLEGELRKARAIAEATEAEVRNDVAASHAALRLAREAVAFQLTTLLPQRQRILKETLLHYNAMQKGNVALLRAKDEEQRAEKDAIESLRDYWLARGELEKAAGGSLSVKTTSKASAPKPAPPVKTGAAPSQEQHQKH